MESASPLATLVVLSYNQFDFIEDAVRGALAQSYYPLQIILSDDASTDGTFERIERLTADYSGPHRLLLNRNCENLGIGRHVNKVMELAEGEIIVAAAGDDISDADRVKAIVDAFGSNKAALSVWSAARYIDEAGRPVGRSFPRPRRSFTDRLIVRNVRPVIGATHAWRREVFDVFGPLLPDVVFEDNAISFRSYLFGAISYIDRELVCYRTHPKNITNFTKIADSKELYAAAAERVGWALAGIQQRKKDLACALDTGRDMRGDSRLLSSELIKMKAVLERRQRSYKCFPSLTWSVFYSALFDLEIAKVVGRSINHKLAQGFRNGA